MQPPNDPVPESPSAPAPGPFPIAAWLFIPLLIPVSIAVACVSALWVPGAAIAIAAAALVAIAWPIIMAIVVWCRYIANSDTGGWSALTTLVRGWLVGGITWLILILISRQFVQSLFAGS